jgi:catechol 2,3-dioxygenase-like lactoylglutathione lyase family enzyme
MSLSSTTPILRIFDEAKAKEFYVGFLGFSVDWEHRFGDNFPLYMQISRDRCIIHLSEHHGDSSPGSALRIETDDVGAVNQELLQKDYRYAKPGVESTPWKTKEMSIADPFGNRLIFFQTVV